MKKKRYSVFNPISDFYRKPANRGKTLADGESNDIIKKWHNDKIARLTKAGYKENVRADITGGDHDYIVIDHKNKEWCWWENGFQPFCVCGSLLPTDHTLLYWSNRRH